MAAEHRGWRSHAEATISGSPVGYSASPIPRNHRIGEHLTNLLADYSVLWSVDHGSARGNAGCFLPDPAPAVLALFLASGLASNITGAD